MNDLVTEKLEEEISLLEIVDFFKDGWKVILLGGIVTGSLGLAYALITPSIYQATASIQVAKVAGADVESPSLLVEKLKIPTYFTQNIFQACEATEKSDPGEFIARSIKPTLSKTAPIVSISFRSNSADDAKKCLESILEEISNDQNTLSKPIIETKNNQLINLRLKLESAESATKLLLSKNQNFNFSDTKFSASTLLLATTLNKENEVKDLRTQINDLDLLLSKPQTKAASLIKPIYAPSLKVEPKRSLIILLSIIVGGVLAIVYLLGRRMWVKMQRT
jgi:LPS O-antigen subunit length determinant protein (WzzB/FepE family)